MKKTIICILTCSLLLINMPSLTAKAHEELSIHDRSISIDATTNLEFAAEKDKLFFQQLINGTLATSTQEEIDSLVEKATFADELEKSRYIQQLETVGVYYYETESSSSCSLNDISVNEDIFDLNVPQIFYQSVDRTWTVTTSGCWLTNDWNTNIFPGNIGGKNGYGVGFTSTSDTYSSSVVRSSAYISDDSYNEMETINYRSDGDGSYGYGFRLQDYSYFDENGLERYVGDIWYTSCSYDYNFGSFSGAATSYFTHTYGSSYIESVSFNIAGKAGGVHVDLSDDSKGETYCSNDIRFGSLP